jgi:hypothetical protein
VTAPDCDRPFGITGNGLSSVWVDPSARAPGEPRRVDTLANDTHHAMPLLYYRRQYLRIERAATAEVEGKPEA